MIKVGDNIILKRRYSEINGWSCRPDLDGALVEVLEVEDRVNGGITITLPEGGRGFIFRDAVGYVTTPKEDIK